MSSAAITFGDLPLLESTPASGGDYEIDVCAEGTDYGNATATVAEVASMLLDGEKAQITRYGNRTAVLELRVKGSSLDAVAAGTTAIELEVNRGRNTLSWLPPGWATASVFDVVYSTLEFKTDDLAEAKQVTRYFTLTLYCLPFARRADLSSVVATAIAPGAPTITPINACTSLTGWTTIATSAVVSGTIVVQRMNYGATSVASAALTASYTLAAGEYAVWEIKLPTGRTPEFWFNGGSVVGVVKATEAVAGGSIRYYVSPSATSFGVTSSHVTVQPLASGETLAIYDLSKYSKLPLIGSGYQRSFAANVGGTARTTADIILDCGSGDTGAECVVFSAPADVLSPPLRTWRTAGTASSISAGAVSGALNTFAAPSVYTIPANLLKPGSYALVGRFIGAGATTFTWTAKTLTTYATAGTDVTGATALTLTGTYTNYQLGVLDLPTIDVDPTSSATVEITLASSATSGTTVDELWLFNIDDGVLTWVSGLTTPATKFEARSATIDRDRPGWLIGTTGTDRDNISVAERCRSAGEHQFPPGDLAIYIVTPGSTATSVTVEYYERFRHHVPPKAS